MLFPIWPSIGHLRHWVVVPSDLLYYSDYLHLFPEALLSNSIASTWAHLPPASCFALWSTADVAVCHFSLVVITNGVIIVTNARLLETVAFIKKITEHIAYCILPATSTCTVPLPALEPNSKINRLHNFSLYSNISPDFPPASKRHPMALCFLLPDTIQGCPEFVFALCLRRRCNTDPHAAFGHSVREENIWWSHKHSFLFSPLSEVACTPLIPFSLSFFFFFQHRQPQTLRSTDSSWATEREAVAPNARVGLIKRMEKQNESQFCHW